MIASHLMSAIVREGLEPLGAFKRIGVAPALGAPDADPAIPGAQVEVFFEGFEHYEPSPETLLMVIASDSRGNPAEAPKLIDLRDAARSLLALANPGDTSLVIEGRLAPNDFTEVYARIGSEYVRITGVQDSSPPAQTTLTVVRGRLGTAPASHLAGEAVYPQWPNFGAFVIATTDDRPKPPAPEDLSYIQVSDSLIISFTWPPSSITDPEEVQQLRRDLDRFLIAWREGQDFTAIEDADGTQLLGSTSPAVWKPPIGRTGYYVRLQAVPLEGPASDLSAALQVTLQDTVEPAPFPAFACEAEPMARFTIKARAYPQDGSATVVNVASGRFEIYQGANPESAPSPSDPLTDFHVVPGGGSLSHVFGITVRLTPEQQFWVRFQATSGIPAAGPPAYVSDWALSPVVLLSAIYETTDTGVPSGLTLGQSLTTLPNRASAWLLLGAVAVNEDSCTRTRLQLQEVGASAFSSDPDTGGFASPEVDEAMQYRSFYTSQLASRGKLMEATFQALNAYGWSDWMAPVVLSLESPPQSLDSGKHSLAGFGAWTAGAPHPTQGAAKLNGLSARIIVRAGDSNRSTLHTLEVYGHSSFPFPSEAVLASAGQADVSVNIVKLLGAGTFAANELAFKWIRFSREATGSGLPFPLEERRIGSNNATSGGVTELFLLGDRPAAANQGVLAQGDWEVIDQPLAEKVDFFKPVVLVENGQINQGWTTYEETVPLQAGDDFYWGCIPHNAFRRGAFRYSDTTEAGSLTTPTQKPVQGVDLESEVTGKLQGGNASPTVVSDHLIWVQMNHSSGDTWVTSDASKIGTAFGVEVWGGNFHSPRWFTVGADPDDDKITFTAAWASAFGPTDTSMPLWLLYVVKET